VPRCGLPSTRILSGAPWVTRDSRILRTSALFLPVRKRESEGERQGGRERERNGERQGEREKQRKRGVVSWDVMRIAQSLSSPKYSLMIVQIIFSILSASLSVTLLSGAPNTQSLTHWTSCRTHLFSSSLLTRTELILIFIVQNLHFSSPSLFLWSSIHISSFHLTSLLPLVFDLFFPSLALPCLPFPILSFPFLPFISFLFPTTSVLTVRTYAGGELSVTPSACSSLPVAEIRF
jgi:hypothetical protein